MQPFESPDIVEHLFIVDRQLLVILECSSIQIAFTRANVPRTRLVIICEFAENRIKSGQRDFQVSLGAMSFGHLSPIALSRHERGDARDDRHHASCYTADL